MGRTLLIATISMTYGTIDINTNCVMANRFSGRPAQMGYPALKTTSSWRTRHRFGRNNGIYSRGWCHATSCGALGNMGRPLSAVNGPMISCGQQAPEHLRTQLVRSSPFGLKKWHGTFRSSRALKAAQSVGHGQFTWELSMASTGEEASTLTGNPDGNSDVVSAVHSRRRQYGLRTLFVLVLLLGVALAGLAYVVQSLQQNDTNREIEAVEIAWSLEGSGDPDLAVAPPALDAGLRNDTETLLDIRRIHLTDGVRQQLSRLRRVQWLRMCTETTAEDLAWISRLSQLRGLSLEGGAVKRCRFRMLETTPLPATA